ncbi:MAG: DAK2 domain-containing protein [Clostridia bacterium]|nr:DAK2 domain-containing protein [Clostridia bacterium]
MICKSLDAAAFMRLVRGGAGLLQAHESEVNGLNVFPIPDGDTGSNMLLTIRGGAEAGVDPEAGIGEAARTVADAMLMSARGNSGVILSQLADGFAKGLEGTVEAGPDDICRALRVAVEAAYAAVLEPVEGTMLTVAREAAEALPEGCADDVAVLISEFIEKAEDTLEHTPDMLAVLKEAGVVDSGGAGLVYIAKGMELALRGENADVPGSFAGAAPAGGAPDFSRFGEDSELEYGYCTELLLRLQRSKCDPASFDENIIREFLATVGDSVVCIKNGSIVKMHVHTKEPYRVLEFCRRYGEYLTVKIENMTLQHNSLHTGALSDGSAVEKVSPRELKAVGIVTAASGKGIADTFRDMGADVVIEAGSLLNPSAEEFLAACREAGAGTVFILPNNRNAVPAARQAAVLSHGSEDIRIIPTSDIGEGYAALSMFDPGSGDPDGIERDLCAAIGGVLTACVSKCSRTTENGDLPLTEGEYIGVSGKHIVSADCDRLDTALMLADRLDFGDREICIIIRGTDSEAAEEEEIARHIRAAHPGCEVYTVYGGQEIYSYIITLE